jgi:putative spermidine/putrescine transport system ATP-binding protein
MAAELAPPAPLATPGTRGASGAIALRGLTKRYGEETVVNAIAVSIAPGEFFSLLGPSGSGKTHHLDNGRRLCAPRQRYRSARRPRHRRDTAAEARLWHCVSELCDLSPPECLENIAFRLRARRWAKDANGERVTWALELVRLGRFADHDARQLSGGSSSASPWRARSSSTRPSC